MGKPTWEEKIFDSNNIAAFGKDNLAAQVLGFCRSLRAGVYDLPEFQLAAKRKCVTKNAIWIRIDVKARAGMSLDEFFTVLGHCLALVSHERKSKVKVGKCAGIANACRFMVLNEVRRVGLEFLNSRACDVLRKVHAAAFSAYIEGELGRSQSNYSPNNFTGTMLRTDAWLHDLRDLLNEWGVANPAIQIYHRLKDVYEFQNTPERLKGEAMEKAKMKKQSKKIRPIEPPSLQEAEESNEGSYHLKCICLKNH